MRLPPFSTLMTLTRTSCPTATTSFGLLTRRRLISETWRRPSTPPRSTNAPNGVMVLIVPVSSAPGPMAFRVSSARAAAAGRELRHAELVRLADELVGVVDLAESDLRERAEGAETADVDVKAALVARADFPLDRDG